MKKCLWCGKQDDRVRSQSMNLNRFGDYQFSVHEDHVEDLRNWLLFQHSYYMKVQIVLTVLSLSLFFVPLMGALIVLEIVSLILMLTPTPPIKMCERMGVARAKSLIQATGVALLMITSWSLLSMYWLGLAQI